MDINVGRLRAKWALTSAVMLIVMAVFLKLDGGLKAASGFNILDFEAADTAAGVAGVIAAWTHSGMLSRASFLIGLDYLYMPSYGLSLFYGGIAAREAFVRSPGGLRKAVTVLAFAPIAAALFDIGENVIEARALFIGVSNGLVQLANILTVAKFSLAFVGVALSLIGIAGLVTGRLKNT